MISSFLRRWAAGQGSCQVCTEGGRGILEGGSGTVTAVDSRRGYREGVVVEDEDEDSKRAVVQGKKFEVQERVWRGGGEGRSVGGGGGDGAVKGLRSRSGLQ